MKIQRTSTKLLNHYNINTLKLATINSMKKRKIKSSYGIFKDGKDLAYISDTGMPGISDPWIYIS